MEYWEDCCVWRSFFLPTLTSYMSITWKQGFNCYWNLPCIIIVELVSLSPLSLILAQLLSSKQWSKKWCQKCFGILHYSENMMYLIKHTSDTQDCLSWPTYSMSACWQCFLVKCFSLEAVKIVIVLFSKVLYITLIAGTAPLDRLRSRTH